MKAAILVESSSPLEVDDVKLPDKLAYGQVKVKILYSGICGAQINEIDAVKGPDKFLPHLLGHEASGEVLDIGEGVSTVNQGDNVVLHWRPSSGIQSATPRYNWNGTEVNAGWVTTFNEEAIISENRLTANLMSNSLGMAVNLFSEIIASSLKVVTHPALTSVPFQLYLGVAL
jgi:threonine dehydrogenase-like Zn-dependent dehydrogenase